MTTPCLVRCSLGRPWQRAVVVLIVAGLAAPLGLEAARIGLASVWLQTGDLPALRHAQAADPADPEIYDRLGQDRLYDFENSDPREALGNYREATSLAPNRALYWEDLALASESLNDNSSAQMALARALYLSPMTPRVHWLAANYDVNTGRIDTALPQLRKVLELGPTYSQAVYELCLRAAVDPHTVEKSVLPASSEPALGLQYAAFLVTKGQVEAGENVWDDTLTSNRPFPFSQAQPYVDELVRDKEYSRAFRGWQDLERVGAVSRQNASDPGELMFDGGFEREPLNAGFDWRYDRMPYLRLDFADPQPYQGGRCLRMDFTAPSNGEFEPVYQDVAVEPRQSYELSAFVRSEGLTSGSGPCLRVVDLLRPGALDASTPETVGTTDWHQVQVSFSTGPETRFVQVFISRPRCLTFPGQISGSFWIDNVSLKAARNPL